MSFRAYLAACEDGADATGDFIRDARVDSAMPEMTSWEDLKAYLLRMGALPDAVRAGQKVWNEYAAMNARQQHASVSSD
ncbi:MAG: hypothetical protein WDN76_04995 [Alphaproteobacteria bacterium]